MHRPHLRRTLSAVRASNDPEDPPPPGVGVDDAGASARPAADAAADAAGSPRSSEAAEAAAGALAGAGLEAEVVEGEEEVVVVDC